MLGSAAAVAVAAAVGATVVQQRGKDPVASYIERVNAVETAMRGQLASSASAYQEFARTGTITPKSRAKLERAERALRTLESRLREVGAPERARRLRSLVIDLARRQVGIAGEVTGIARFTPAFVDIARQSRVAREQLRRALASAKPARASSQAVALEVYDLAVLRLQRRLRTLAAPAVFQPSRRGALNAFARTHAATVALAAELRRNERPRVAELTRRFLLAARAAATVRVQEAQAAAIRAYNRRVRGLAGLKAKVQAELLRMQQDS